MAASSAPPQPACKPKRPFPILNLKEDFFSVFPYSRGSKLGSGFSGCVFEAVKNSNPEHKRAIKLIPLNDSKLGEERARLVFNRELDIFTQTSHSGLLKCLLVARCPEYLAIVMEHYPLGDLEANLAKIPAAAKPHMAKCLVEAVDHLHQRRFFHSDIKPSNILLRPGFKPVLTDFGFSMRIPGSVKKVSTKGLGGTPLYWPRYVHGAEPGYRVDLFKLDMYALGRTLLCLVLGRDMDWTLLEFDVAANNKMVPRSQRSVLMSLLHWDPEQRISSDVALKQYEIIVREETQGTGGVKK